MYTHSPGYNITYLSIYLTIVNIIDYIQSIVSSYVAAKHSSNIHCAEHFTLKVFTLRTKSLSNQSIRYYEYRLMHGQSELFQFQLEHSDDEYIEKNI